MDSQGTSTTKKRKTILPEDDAAAPKLPSDIGTADDSNSTQPSNYANKQDEEMGHALGCSICCEIIYDCVSLQPCGHCFCGACFSGWMRRSHRCPECRLKVKRAAKNHRMNNLIEIFLQSHPDKQRIADDLATMDAENKISTDIFIVAKRAKRNDDLDSDEAPDMTDNDSSSDSGDDEDDEDNGGEQEEPQQEQPEQAGQRSNVPGPARPRVYTGRRSCLNSVPCSPMNVPVCAQCPNYGRAPFNNMIGSLIRPPTRNDTPVYKCSVGQTHIKCFCCHAFIPDRRRIVLIANWPQECKICRKISCNLYFGCSQLGCNGCLNKFKDFTFEEETYRNIVNENYFESEILKKYLDEKNVSWKQFFQECMSKLDADEFDCKDKQTFNLKSDAVLCVGCALSNLRDLAYEYRKSIPKEDTQAKRENCWYGRNCRTQKSKPAHAEKLNHVCEQTRF